MLDHVKSYFTFIPSLSMRVQEFREGFVDEVAEGGKARVRVLGVDPGAGRVQLTMLD